MLAPEGSRPAWSGPGGHGGGVAVGHVLLSLRPDGHLKIVVPPLDVDIYRVSGLSCPEAGGCKSVILRGFLDVFSLFGPCKVGVISFRYSWTTRMT